MGSWKPTQIREENVISDVWIPLEVGSIRAIAQFLSANQIDIPAIYFRMHGTATAWTTFYTTYNQFILPDMDMDNIYYQSGILFISDNNRSSQNWVQDYEKVLKRRPAFFLPCVSEQKHSGCSSAGPLSPSWTL